MWAGDVVTIETPRTREHLAQLMLDLQDEAAATKDEPTRTLLTQAAAALDGVLYPVSGATRSLAEHLADAAGIPAPRPARTGVR